MSSVTAGPPDVEGDAASAPGPTRRKGKTRGEMTRRRLLDAAEAVFAENGYHDASIVRIVEHAGVAQGTFYIYFRSKLKIFEELVADLNTRLREAMTAGARTTAGDRFQAERGGFAAFFRFTAEHPALYRVIREAEFVAPDAQRRHYEKIIEGYGRALSEAMEAGEIERTDPIVLAWALMAVGQFIGMRWISWEANQEIPEDVYEQCMRIVHRILGATLPPVTPAPVTPPPVTSASVTAPGA
ncbi:MAG: TetR/AcrR family transcriptional regulator [Acidimicrobiales bacterium]